MVYTMVFEVDGACRRNGQTRSNGAAAAVQISKLGASKSWTRVLEGDPTPTNQRAELTAIVIALEVALEKQKELENNPRMDVTIKSDSRYAVCCMTEWMQKWRNNGWKNVAGDDVANGDLLQYLLSLDIELKENCDVYYDWIPRQLNVLADQICNEVLGEQ